MDKKTILSRIPLFEDISSENLAGMADIARLRSIRKKEILFLEGEEGFSLFILVSGAVQLYKGTAEGREIVIKVVRPGEMFAEVILFEQDEYPVNAVALTDSEIITVPRARFIGLLENKQFRNEFIGSLMMKLRYLADHIKYLTHHDVEERFLLFLNEQFGKLERVDVDMTKKEVAAAIGTTPETLSRLLFRLKGEGLLTWKGRSIVIDPRAWEIIGQ